MKTFAEYQIIGSVGKITPAGAALQVSIAADYQRKNERGEWEHQAYWNTVTIFHEDTINWAKDHLRTGDLVHVRGTIRESPYEKNGEIRYGVTLATSMFDVLVAKKRN